MISNFLLRSPAQQPLDALTLKYRSLFHTTAGVLSYVSSTLSLSFFFLHPMPYSILQFMNVTVLHYNVFTKAVYNQISNWL
jgi:hypothetical protein